MSSQDGAPRSVESIVYQLVGRYVRGRLESKKQLSWKDVKEDESKREEFNHEKGRIAKDAFLAVRSRSGADFVDYFASTLCSVSHHLPEAEYGALTKALRAEPQTVRTLTLLALAAHGH